MMLSVWLRARNAALQSTLLLACLVAMPSVGRAAHANAAEGIADVWAMVLEQDQPLRALAMAERLADRRAISRPQLLQVQALVGAMRDDATVASPAADAVPSRATAAQLEAIPAIDWIVERARSTRIVLVNESHRDQRHRAFAFLLARALRKVGYTHFGAETFAPGVRSSMRDGAPDGETGVYTADPVFADLVRGAYAMGFELFPYEQRPDQRIPSAGVGLLDVAAREEAQARNIREILEEDPEAKVFVLAGAGHVREEPDEEGTAWMASRLKAAGFDPLTIDQVAGTPRQAPEADPPLYAALAVSMALPGPSVLVDGSGVQSHHGFDVVVFHPREQSVAGRPDWLGMDGMRRPERLPVRAKPWRTLVRAFLEGEPAGSIPLDQVIVAPGRTHATLVLPAGDYRIERQFESGESTVIGHLRDGDYSEVKLTTGNGD